jgi:hypothetical protein
VGSTPEAGAYWLLDEIALIQPYDPRVAAAEFQVRKLVVRPDSTATLTCQDDNYNVVFRKEIAITDFPLDEFTLWFANDTIYLTSEHSSVRPSARIFRALPPGHRSRSDRRNAGSFGFAAFGQTAPAPLTRAAAGPHGTRLTALASGWETPVTPRAMTGGLAGAGPHVPPPTHPRPAP